MKKRVLLVDDEPRVRASLRTVLEPTYEILEAADAAEGLKSFKHDAPDLVLLDVILPGTDGLAALQTMRTENRAVPVIMLTGTKSVKTAVDAMKLGAADYLSKPFDVEELQIVIERTLGKQELEQEVRQLRAQVVQRYAFHNLIGKSPAMQEIYAKIEQVADSRTTVLVTGESGTGKELVAKAIHYNSARRERPFVALNCAALPETLIESELFGHEKGSFTDATARRVGQFELAHTGTLFLDEIGDLSAATQAKLLRVLQEREFTRVGGVQSIKVDVRIVAATNKNLDEMVRKNQFREDLYYRINVIALYLPPLRERGEDIALLAKHFLAKRIEEEKRPPQEFTKGSLELISHYPWPGNVREMENIIEQAFIWSKGSDVITPEHLPNILRTDTRSTSLRDDTLAGRLSLEKAVMEFEREIILDALKRTTYVQTHAAAMLGISRRMLKYRMDT
ncbi:MAG: sigma-54 dependent transcriptional regulator, partial [Nitrospira sp.]